MQILTTVRFSEEELAVLRRTHAFTGWSDVALKNQDGFCRLSRLMEYRDDLIEVLEGKQAETSPAFWDTGLPSSSAPDGTVPLVNVAHRSDLIRDMVERAQQVTVQVEEALDLIETAIGNTTLDFNRGPVAVGRARSRT